MFKALAILAILVTPAVAQPMPLQWADPAIKPFWQDLERLAEYDENLVFYRLKSDLIEVQVAWTGPLCGRDFCPVRAIENGQVVFELNACNDFKTYRLEDRFFCHCGTETYLGPGD